MAGSKRAATEEETVAPRINSGNLSDQFHRELSSNGDDLLQAELTIDDINSASGSGVSPYSSLNTTPLSSPARPNMLPSIPANTWQPPVSQNASPFAAYSGAPGTSTTTIDSTSFQDGRISNGTADSSTAKAGASSTSNAFTQAYRQPSKIPRLASASSVSQQSALPTRQGSRDPHAMLPLVAVDKLTAQSQAMDTKLRQGSARTASGAMRKNSAALPAASKAKVPKPPPKSPSQSLSDTSEDPSLPAWRLATKVPAAKYTQQRDKALGGPFERSSNSSLVKPASKAKGKSTAQAYASSSSSQAAQDMQRYRKEHSRNSGRFQEPQLATDQLSSIHVLPSSTLPDADLEPSELQPFENTAQAADNRTEGGAAALQEPADMVQPGGMTQQPPHSQGLHPDQGLQPGQGFEPGTNGNAEVAQLHGVQQPHVEEELNPAGIQQPATQAEVLSNEGEKAISSDQVGIEVKPEHNPAQHSGQLSQAPTASHTTISESDEAKLNKKVKCCGCTIM